MVVATAIARRRAGRDNDAPAARRPYGCALRFSSFASSVKTRSGRRFRWGPVGGKRLRAVAREVEGSRIAQAGAGGERWRDAAVVNSAAVKTTEGVGYRPNVPTSSWSSLSKRAALISVAPSFSVATATPRSTVPWGANLLRRCARSEDFGVRSIRHSVGGCRWGWRLGQAPWSLTSRIAGIGARQHRRIRPMHQRNRCRPRPSITVRVG